MKKEFRELVLAIEPGIEGGSVSILRDGEVLDFATGQEAVSRSEDLLRVIEEILGKNNINKHEIGLIVVSSEPGSTTGLRIGLATAMGLAASVSAELVKLSAFEALVKHSRLVRPITTSILDEKKGVFQKKYGEPGSGEPTMDSAFEILKPQGIGQFIKDSADCGDSESIFFISEKLKNKLLRGGISIETAAGRVVVSGVLSSVIGAEGARSWRARRG